MQSYIPTTLGLRTSIPKKPSDNLILVQNSTFATTYDFSEIMISGIAVIVARRKSDVGLNGTNLGKEFYAMKEYFSFPLLLELQSIDVTMRKLLIGKKVNFVVPGHQLHFPELCISLSEQNIGNKSDQDKTLTISAQVLLLYHLQKQSLAGMYFKDIAQIIGYSHKTITLIAMELCNFGIIQIETKGRNKCLRFYKHGLDLYNQIDKWLQTPVISKGYTDRNVENIGAVQVNIGSQIHTYIISSNKAKELNLKAYATPKTYRIAIWKYDPRILETDGIADVLSLLLSKIDILYGRPNRYNYLKAKPIFLERVKWTDT